MQSFFLICKDMLSRRFIRVKVFKILFSSVHSQNFDQAVAEKELLASFEKTRQLYYLLLSLPVELANYAQSRIYIGLNKYQPTDEEINPNLRFVNNKAITILEKGKALVKAREHGLNWALHKGYIKKLYEQFRKEPYFIEYMNAPQEPGFAEDLKLLQDFFSDQPEDDPDLYTLLEDQSLYRADDIAYVCNIILAQLAGMKEGKDMPAHPSLFNNQEDKDFATELLAHSLAHYKEFVGYIEKFAQNWDLERIAATDTILIVMGVAESVAFPQIPVKVTLNEIVEISKYYSTDNSKMFVNGILDKIIKHLVQEGIIAKRGRGLVEK